MSKNGVKITKGIGSSAPELSKDDPIYKRGIAIGVVRSTGSKSTVAPTSPSSKTPQEPPSNQK